jgi:hypothetical protein
MSKIPSKRFVIVLLVLAVAVIGARLRVKSDSTPVSTAKTHQAAAPGNVHIRLFDSVTGYGIQPNSLDAVTMKSAALELRTQKIEDDNTVFLQAEQGTYDLAVRIEGYQPVTTKVSVEEESTALEILLDPVQTPPEMTAESIKSLTRPDVASVIGYIVDEKSGRALPRAKVSLADGTIATRTNSRGFFVLQIPVEGNNAEGAPVLKDILFQMPGYTSEERQSIQVFRGLATIYLIRLTLGNGTNTIDEKQNRNNAAAQFDAPAQTSNAPPPGSASAESDSSAGTREELSQSDLTTVQPASVSVPTYIRVGFNCPDARSCTGTMMMSLDDYCKHVLPAEWFASWDMNSLKAGAVAVRSFSAWYVTHPLSSRYDICGTSSCQVFGNTTVSSTNAAIDQTTGIVLIDGNDNIIRSEFAAENNDKPPCGRDCQTGTCISDVVCCGDFSAGHGRGMCQNGSQRWAIGTKYGSHGPVPSGNSPKDWIWILNHYYPSNKIAGLPASDFSITTTPIVQTVVRGSTGTCRVDIQSLNGFNGQVALSALGLPPGYAGAFWTPSSLVTVPVNGTSSSTLVVFTNSNTSTGIFGTTIQAASGSLVKNKFIQFIITAGNFNDQQAQQDMRNRASRDGRFLSAIPQTFGSNLNWTSDFELRWMAFNFAGNRIVIMYHARAKASGDRFTTFYDPDTQRWTDWQLAN